MIERQVTRSHFFSGRRSQLVVLRPIRIEVVIVETEQGRGILGVIDGGKSKGIEDESGVAWRK
jgi:adenosine/AMP kinase